MKLILLPLSILAVMTTYPSNSYSSDSERYHPSMGSDIGRYSPEEQERPFIGSEVERYPSSVGSERERQHPSSPDHLQPLSRHQAPHSAGTSVCNGTRDISKLRDMSLRTEERKGFVHKDNEIRDLAMEINNTLDLLRRTNDVGKCQRMYDELKEKMEQHANEVNQLIVSQNASRPLPPLPSQPLSQHGTRIKEGKRTCGGGTETAETEASFHEYKAKISSIRDEGLRKKAEILSTQIENGMRKLDSIKEPADCRIQFRDIRDKLSLLIKYVDLGEVPEWRRESPPQAATLPQVGHPPLRVEKGKRYCGDTIELDETITLLNEYEAKVPLMKNQALKEENLVLSHYIRINLNLLADHPDPAACRLRLKTARDNLGKMMSNTDLRDR